MKKILMFLYGALAGFYWIAGLMCFILIFAVALIVGIASGTPGNNPPSWLMWFGTIISVMLPIIIRITGKKFIARSDIYANGIVIAIDNRNGNIVEFGDQLWKKKNHTYEQLPQYPQLPKYLREHFTVMIEKEVGNFIINIPIRFSIVLRNEKKDLDYYKRLRRALAKGSFEDQFKKAVENKFADSKNDILSSIFSNTESDESLEADILEKLAITNPFYDLIGVEISVEGIDIRRMLPQDK